MTINSIEAKTIKDSIKDRSFINPELGEKPKYLKITYYGKHYFYAIN
ncbi:hypothetical protein JYT51_01960 [Candidatus Amoebophilus asiaticus]|nr:hypothetical protein [Candidatus Amoebophilus asiaticus]